jgi:RNA polymerase sigma-70 factor (ECF subfamily)
LAIAMANVDQHALRAVMDPRVALTVDSGGAISSALVPLSGSNEAASELVALVLPDTTVSMASINGSTGFLLIRQGSVVGAVTAHVRSGKVVSVWAVCNPAKLRRWNEA